MSPFPGQPDIVNFASGSALIEDAEEEIFLLYVRKQATLSPPTPTAPLPSTSSSSRPRAPSHSSKQQQPPKLDGSAGGLGFLSSKQELLEVELSIVPPPSAFPAAEAALSKVRKGKGRARDAPAKEVLVRVQVQQSLETLRNKRGDTGSVLWRVSLHLAQLLLTQHHFPRAEEPPLFPRLQTSRVLELGSGTGFLGLALKEAVESWTFTDQLESLSLVRKNLERNGVMDGDLEEVDWLVESAPRTNATRSSRAGSDEEEAPKADMIIAADCVYNPSLSAPLARTIDRLAARGSVVLVASELRDEEPLELFLKEWVELGWSIVRPELGAEAIGGREYVVWVGWRNEAA